MKNKIIWAIFLLGLLIGGCVLFKKNHAPPNDQRVALSIDQLTKETVVLPYLRKNKKLPDYYITKNEARQNGWVPAEGNLCKVLPGKAIGGDIYTDREKNLPDTIGRKWYEADLNYNCGRRNANRLLYSNDGLIYATYDHYKTFEKR